MCWDWTVPAAIYPGCEPPGAVLRAADFAHSQLAGADLRGANLSAPRSAMRDLPAADFSGADVEGVDFRGADLRGADFRKASLFGVWLVDETPSASESAATSEANGGRPDIVARVVEPTRIEPTRVEPTSRRTAQRVSNRPRGAVVASPVGVSRPGVGSYTSVASPTLRQHFTTASPIAPNTGSRRRPARSITARQRLIMACHDDHIEQAKRDMAAGPCRTTGRSRRRS
jgi:hypothetical protein